MRTSRDFKIPDDSGGIEIQIKASPARPPQEKRAAATLSSLVFAFAILAAASNVMSSAQTDVTQPGDKIIASSTNSPGSENVANAIDNSPAKYLNFDSSTPEPIKPSGFVVSPTVAPTLVTGMTIESANDAPERDPKTVTLEGSNDAVITNFTIGNWELIATVNVPDFSSRFQTQSFSFPNSKTYSHYRWTVTETLIPNPCCMQVAEVELLGVPDSPPSISFIASQIIDEDTMLGPLSFSISDAETPANNLTLEVTSSNPNLIRTNSIVLGGTGSARTISLIPEPNQSGLATIVLTVQDAAGAKTSSIFQVTVNPVNDPPTISGLGNINISQNGSASEIFTVNDVDSPLSTLTLNGDSDNTTLIPNSGIMVSGSGSAGGSDRTVTLTPAANVTGVATITVKVTDSANASSSVQFSVTVTAVPNPPSIITPPSSQSVEAGATATFKVVAGGTAPFSYQWLKNGSSIPGATSATYTIGNVTSAAQGDYSVLVSNAAGNITSSSAILTVISPPFIITPPSNQSVAAGETATFTVVASGTAPLSYQWFKNGSPIPGATSKTYTLNNVTSAAGGTYTVAVSNTAGTVTSGAAILTVAPAVITESPSDQTLPLTGQFPLVLKASVRSDLPVFYQWRRNGANIPGAQGPTYTAPNATLCDGGLYELVAYNALGPVKSDPAIVSPLGQNAGVLTDNFAQRVRIENSVFGSIVTSNSFATSEPGEPCHAGKPASKSLWMDWVAPRSGSVTFDTCGSAFDTVLAVYSGTEFAVGRKIAPTDIVDLPAIVTRLQDSNDTLFRYLRSLLSPSGKNLVDAGTITPDALAQELEGIVAGRILFYPGLSDEIELRCETTALAANPQAPPRLLNRLLLEDIFPGALLKEEGLTPIVSSEDSDKPTPSNGAKELLYTSRVSFNVQALGVYTIAVDGFYGATGQIVLSWTFNALSPTLPEIKVQPKDVGIDIGQSAAFSIVVARPDLKPMTFFWYRGDDLIYQTNFAQGPILITNTYWTRATIETIGTYSVIVSNATGVVRSDRAVLQLTSTPGIILYDKREDARKGTHLVFGGANSQQSIAKQSLRQLGVPSPAAGALSFNSMSFSTDSARVQMSETENCQLLGETRWLDIDINGSGVLFVDGMGSLSPMVVTLYKYSNGVSLEDPRCASSGTPDKRSLITWTIGNEGKVKFEIQVDALKDPTSLAAAGVVTNISLNCLFLDSSAAAAVGLLRPHADQSTLNLRVFLAHEGQWSIETSQHLPGWPGTLRFLGTGPFRVAPISDWTKKQLFFMRVGTSAAAPNIVPEPIIEPVH